MFLLHKNDQKYKMSKINEVVNFIWPHPDNRFKELRAQPKW
jgi:hypothetical protein